MDRTIIHPGGVTMSLHRHWTVNEIAKLFGVENLNMLELSRDRVMLVIDDESKPINHAATAMYFAGNPMGLEHIICGPVAILPVSDFLVTI